MSNMPTPYTTPIAHRQDTEYATPLPQTPRNTPQAIPVHTRDIQNATPTPTSQITNNIVHETPEQIPRVPVIPGAPKKPKNTITLLDTTPTKYNN